MGSDIVGTFGRYDFGLTADEEERAARLQHDSLVIDVIFQGPIGYRGFTDDMIAELQQVWQTTRDPTVTMVRGLDLPIWRALAGDLPAYRGVWDETGITGVNVQVELSSLRALAWRFGVAQAAFDGFDWLHKALRADDFRRAKAAGGHAAMINTQMSTGPFPDLETLRHAYDLGLRMVQLTYNSLSTVGAGCTERTDAGVSRFGAQAIDLMNALGIMVDTGHCGRQTTLDACHISQRPVVASHTAAAALHQHDRNKSDEEFEAIAANGGVIGVVTVPFFLAPGNEVTIEAMLDHVDHITRVAGAEHVAIGTDWPMQLPRWLLREIFGGFLEGVGFRDEHRIAATTNLVGFDDYRDFPNITRGLVRRGYTDEQIRGILGENFLRVFASVCG